MYLKRLTSEAKLCGRESTREKESLLTYCIVFSFIKRHSMACSAHPFKNSKMKLDRKM